MPDAAPKRYAVKILPSAQRDLDDLEKGIFSRVIPVFQGSGNNPRPHGSLKLAANEGYRFRVASYRVAYRIDDKGQAVFIYRVKHRREAYR